MGKQVAQNQTHIITIIRCGSVLIGRVCFPKTAHNCLAPQAALNPVCTKEPMLKSKVAMSSSETVTITSERTIRIALQ